MLEQFDILYGAAVTLRIGSLRSSDPAVLGAYVTPTFASGDVTTEQDDGSGFETADDPTPTLDGTCIELDVSAAEAAVPAALAGRRIYRIVDQDGPAWVPREIQIVTTDHHLAAKPNGVTWAGLGHASSQTTNNVRLGADPVITIRKGYYGTVTEGTGAGQAFYVKSYSTTGSAYNLTLADETPLFVALDATSVIKLYVDRPAWLSNADIQDAVTDAELALLGTVVRNGNTDLQVGGASFEITTDPVAEPIETITPA